jgi:hypothetical protein
VASLDRKFIGLERGSCSNVPTGISTAVLEVEDGVVHLVAEKLWEPSAEINPTGAACRDFPNGNFALRATVPH